jgi:cytoskeletal protein RodZ
VFEIGESLREARIKRNLSPGDVQKAIRIRDRYLQALEEERWELLPGDAYVKGFLRSYADFLGLDANLYIDEYNSRFSHAEEPQFAPQPLRKARPASRRAGWLRPLLAIGVIVAIVVGVAAWQLGRSPQKSGTPPPATATKTGTTKTATTTTTTHKKSKKQHHTALPTRAVLVASRGDCWLWVRSGSASGPTVYEGTLLQGKTLPVSLKKGPLWIRVGDPGSLDVRLGGKIASGLPSQTGNVLLTRHGLSPA